MEQRTSEKAKKAAWGIHGSRYTISTKNGIDSTWGIPLTQEEIQMFRKWDTDDPVGEWEKIRDSLIEEIQGNTREQGKGLWGKST